MNEVELPLLSWCAANSTFLQSPPHPSALPYHLHRSVFLHITDPALAINYAKSHLMAYIPSQPVLQLITSCVYPVKPVDPDQPMSNPDPDSDSRLISPYQNDPAPLVTLFSSEYCRRHGWAKEEPLGVVVDLGSRGGALNVIEKARRVMGDHLGHVRTWQELPVRFRSSRNRTFLNGDVLVCVIDGGPLTFISTISLDLRLPRVEGTSDGDQSAEDAHVRTHDRR